MRFTAVLLLRYSKYLKRKPFPCVTAKKHQAGISPSLFCCSVVVWVHRDFITEMEVCLILAASSRFIIRRLMSQRFDLQDHKCAASVRHHRRSNGVKGPEDSRRCLEYHTLNDLKNKTWCHTRMMRWLLLEDPLTFWLARWTLQHLSIKSNKPVRCSLVFSVGQFLS